MRLREDPWLAGVLERPVFRVDGASPPDPGSLREHAAAHSGGLYWARVPTEDVAAARDLAAAGFYPVDTTVTFRRHTDAPPEPPVATIIRCCDTHAEEVVEIGGMAFGASRFHLDPAIPDELANRVKRNWARNNATGERGVACSVALRHGRPEGFLSVLATNGDAQRRVIDLVAVRPESQGRGVGRALVEAFIRHHGTECDELEVGTQAANVASLSMYGSLGFRVWRTSYVMHLHAAA
ncbi:MAG: GNAT family N-acetyltransferase [Miltoncostaeaceae bacterium]